MKAFAGLLLAFLPAQGVLALVAAPAASKPLPNGRPQQGEGGFPAAEPFDKQY